VLKGESPAKSPPVTIEFVPGTKFRYAGGNYAIVQQILVDVTGEQFPDLMQELVLRPLHMVHSTFQESIPQNLHADIAMPFDKDGNAIEGGPRNYPEMAGSGLWTNPSDLALFALAIQDAFGGKPGAIMSVSMAREMLQPVAGDYALGFFVDGNGPNRYFWHPGANRGFLAFFFAYEKGDGVVLMSNAQQSKPLMLEVIRALSKQYGWTQFPTASRFSDLRGIGLICVCIAGITYALFLVRRRASNFRSRRDPAM